MITGSHSIVYTTDPDADRAFFRDVLKLDSIDAGEGWLLFALPPSEVAFHPAEVNDRHEFFFLTDDIDAFVTEMNGREVDCTPLHEQEWGRLTYITLPGGGKVGVYEPLHDRP